MSIDTKLLSTLMTSLTEESSDYLLHINNKTFQMTNVDVSHSPTPVNEPTTRGGVYFSDKFAYKMTGVISDLSVIPFLTKKMLGPNTEFGELKITTKINSIFLEIFTNLTNSVQTPNSIELSMIVVKLESV
ncbi:MAG: hypothetical protein HOK63_06710 [Thaumarchaeota archaeon]|jgi:hypothetical protein|nr:hypothetical protein [Nitrososphaerota archaeon]MBT5843140.1 hypothetical protein [Nitrososphaerota archaeon]MBT6469320.1 hypothetical protein [Nitrososphaerota archaeon]